MRRAKTALVVALMLFIAAPGAGAANRNREKDIVVAIALPPSLMNEGSATIIDYSNRLRKVVNRKTGLNMKWKILADWDDVVAAVQKRQADFAALPAYYYAKTMADPRSALQPFVTFASNESVASPFCLYTRKENEYFTIDHLLNMRLAIGDEDDWALLNVLFGENGVPFPPAEFFEEIKPMTAESAFSALVFNKVDAIFFDTLSMAYVLENSPQASRVASIECTSTLTNLLIVNRKGVDRDVLGKLEKVLMNMHNDPDFKEFHRFLAPTKGRWVEAKNTYYSDWEPVIAEMKKRGWDREYEKILKNSSK